MCKFLALFNSEKKVPPQDEPQEPIEDDDKKPMLELEPEDKPEVE